MFKKLVATIAVLGAFAALVSYGTLAIFTDQDALGGNTFDSATIDLTTSPTSGLLSFSGMVPGDSVTAALTVANGAGSAALRYAVTASATDDDSLGLRDQLGLTIRTVDATTPGTPCNDFDGTLLHNGSLVGSGGALIGDAAQGEQAGDRALDAGANEILCFRASLPLATGNAFQGAATTATFVFHSEQTANNP